MNLRNPYRPQIPDYYDTMFLDGYEPWQILASAHKKMLATAKRAEEEPEPQAVHITSEVRVVR